MKIAVSACLLGTNCKYDGGNNLNTSLASLLAGHEIVPVCPEGAGGLPCPRVPAEIADGKVVTRDGRDVTDAFDTGAKRCFEKVKDCDLAILKSRSPSCGSSAIYDGSFTGQLTAGEGIFARMLKEAHIPILEADAFCHEDY